MLALLAAAIFLLLATFTAMPVSTTHAIVSAVVGITIAGTAPRCLNWAFNGGLGGIVASWIISPLLSGLLGAGLYLAIQSVIMKKHRPRELALFYAPFLYGGTVFAMAVLILKKATLTKHVAVWWDLLAGAGAGVTAGVLAWAFVMPRVIASMPSSGAGECARTSTEAGRGGGATGDNGELHEAG